MKLPISKHQAAALRDDITEINQLNQLVQVKTAANKRHVDTMIRDLSYDPDAFLSYNVEAESGEWFLVLQEKMTA